MTSKSLFNVKFITNLINAARGFLNLKQFLPFFGYIAEFQRMRIIVSNDVNNVCLN